MGNRGKLYNNWFNNNFNSEIDNNNTLTVLYFNWKTWEHDVYKIKEVSTGAKKAIEKAKASSQKEALVIIRGLHRAPPRPGSYHPDAKRQSPCCPHLA